MKGVVDGLRQVVNDHVSETKRYRENAESKFADKPRVDDLSSACRNLQARIQGLSEEVGSMRREMGDVNAERLKIVEDRIGGLHDRLNHLANQTPPTEVDTPFFTSFFLCF